MKSCSGWFATGPLQFRWQERWNHLLYIRFCKVKKGFCLILLCSIS